MARLPASRRSVLQREERRSSLGDRGPALPRIACRFLGRFSNPVGASRTWRPIVRWDRVSASDMGPGPAPVGPPRACCRVRRGASGGRRFHQARPGWQHVLRRRRRWTVAVHSLLRHLEEAGFDGAPRVIGMEGDHEVLYLRRGPPRVRPRPPALLQDCGLEGLGRLLRGCHELDVVRPLPSGAGAGRATTPVLSLQPSCLSLWLFRPCASLSTYRRESLPVSSPRSGASVPDW